MSVRTDEPRYWTALIGTPDALGSAFELLSMNAAADELEFAGFLATDAVGALISSGAKAIGTGGTNVGGVEFTSTTAAGAGAQEYGPPIISGGQGWETDGSSSVAVLFQTQTVPVQGAAAPTVNRIWQSKVGAGSLTTRMTLTSAGALTVTTVIATSLFSSSASGLTFGNSANGSVQRQAGAVGLGQGVVLRQGSANDETVQIYNTGLTDSADGVAVGSSWDIQAASPTHAATVRVHGFYTTSAANTKAEKASVRANGDFYCGQSTTGEAFGIKKVGPTLVTIDADAETDTGMDIPVDALVVGVPVLVETEIPGPTATFDVGVAGVTNRYGDDIAVAATTKSPGTIDALRHYASGDNRRILITPNANPGAATGKVRVTIFYLELTPSQS